MLKYNTSEKQLALPEYGRNIQRMVEYCLRIEDREERTNCAFSIIEAMKNVSHLSSGEKGNLRKLWDHLNIISNFSLDIDFPFEISGKENLHPKPEKIPYSRYMNKYRHYGKNIVELVKKVNDMENGIEKDNMIFLIANQMKKLLVSQNPENASDIRVFKDIEDITNGGIIINPETYRLNEYIGVAINQTVKKKKKK